MSSSGGRLLVAEAFAQSKMADSSKWHGLLPRCITPSDVDLVFDDDGYVLACEFSRFSPTWIDLAQSSRGQFRLYDSLIRKPGVFAVLLQHNAPTTRPIDTLLDVQRFSVLAMGKNNTRVMLNNEGHEAWRDFVLGWFRCGASVHAKCKYLNSLSGWKRFVV